MRFAGVLAPRSKWRALVVPRPPKATTAAQRSAPCVDACGKPEHVSTPDRLVATHRPSCVAPTASASPPPAVFAHTLAAHSDAVEVVAPNVLSLAHWARLRDGELYAALHHAPPDRLPSRPSLRAPPCAARDACARRPTDRRNLGERAPSETPPLPSRLRRLPLPAQTRYE